MHPSVPPAARSGALAAGHDVELPTHPGHLPLEVAVLQLAQRVQAEQEEKLRATQRELGQFMQSYYDQAKSFYDKRYYSAASDLLKLIFDIQPDNGEARLLQRDIYAAIDADIAARIAAMR